MVDIHQFIFLVWLFSASLHQYQILADDNSNVVIASDYEKRFHQIFQDYWERNRTVTENLTSIVNETDRPGLKLADIPNCSLPKKCVTCRAFTYSMLQFYRNDSAVSNPRFNEYLYELCTVLAKIHDYNCRGSVNIYGPTIKYILMNRANQLSSDKICGILFQYNGCSANKGHISFKIDVDNRNGSTSETNKMNKISSPMQSQLTIAHLSDFHYDHLYAPGSSSNCQDFICCRNTSVPKTNSIHQAGQWGDYFSCDSPGYLVENICSQVADNHEVDIVYYTGDFMDHFGWITTKDIVKHSIDFITSQIKMKFPNAPVAMVIGNHDIHPSDTFGSSDNSSKWLYEYVADLWSGWLPQSALKTLRYGGYYTFVIQPGLRVIVLNNNLCFTHNVWLLYGSNDMIIQLEWLRDTLIDAEINGEKVHILGHIPPNTASCIRAWNREYNKIIRRFASIISGQFNGHTHTDEFTLYYNIEMNNYQDDDEHGDDNNNGNNNDNSTKIAINVAWNGGSGTSFIGLNSNYRLYTIDGNSYEVLDHETWIFNLTEANLHPHKSPEWFKEYSFRDAFGINDLEPKTLSELVDNIFRNDKQSLQRYWQFKVKMADPKLKKGCDDDCLENFRKEANGERELNFF